MPLPTIRLDTEHPSWCDRSRCTTTVFERDGVYVDHQLVLLDDEEGNHVTLHGSVVHDFTTGQVSRTMSVQAGQIEVFAGDELEPARRVHAALGRALALAEAEPTAQPWQGWFAEPVQRSA